MLESCDSLPHSGKKCNEFMSVSQARNVYSSTRLWNEIDLELGDIFSLADFPRFGLMISSIKPTLGLEVVPFMALLSPRLSDYCFNIAVKFITLHLTSVQLNESCVLRRFSNRYLAFVLCQIRKLSWIASWLH